MKSYKFKNGMEICKRSRPCGAFYAMGETQIEEETVFDVIKDGKLIATAETWEQAKGMVFDSILIGANNEKTND